MRPALGFETFSFTGPTPTTGGTSDQGIIATVTAVPTIAGVIAIVIAIKQIYHKISKQKIIIDLIAEICR